MLLWLEGQERDEGRVFYRDFDYWNGNQRWCQMKDMFIFLLVLSIIITCSALGFNSCSDIEARIKQDGLKSIVNELWEGAK